MPIRASWAVGSDTERVIDVEDARLSNAAAWLPAGPATARTGFRPASPEPATVTASSTPDEYVHVAPFQMVLQSNRGAGAYVLTVDSPIDIDVLSTPADPSNPRNDLIVVQQNDRFYGDPDSSLQVRHIVGTPAPTPADPTVDGSADYVILARVRVAANAVAITPSDITDLRPTNLYTVAVGGILPISSQTERNAIANPYPGLTIYRLDANWLETYTGTGWRIQGVAAVNGASDLALITHPYSGQIVSVEQAETAFIYRGGQWNTITNEPCAILRKTTTQSLPNNTWTNVTFNAEDRDTHDGHSTTTNPERYTAQRAGVYLLTGGCGFAGNTTGRRGIRWAVNGTPLSGSGTLVPPYSNAIYLPARAKLVRLNIGDYVTMQAYQESGGALNLEVGSEPYANPTMEIVWVAP